MQTAIIFGYRRITHFVLIVCIVYNSTFWETMLR